MPDQSQSDEAAAAIAGMGGYGAGTDEEQRLQKARLRTAREHPTQLSLFDVATMDEFVDEESLSRSEQIAIECVENSEPFFVLRAKDIFSVMAVHNYAKLVEEYGPLDIEFHGNLSDLVQEMREWQQSNPDRVKYPD